MRKYKQIDLLVDGYNDSLNKQKFIKLLVDDLKNACCFIFGETVEEQLVLLAELSIQADSLHLNTGLFHQGIEFIVEGEIINDQYPPLTYKVTGETIHFYGRCSTIAQICGVDLYLDKSYTEKIGDKATQKFILPVSKLFRLIK